MNMLTRMVFRRAHYLKCALMVLISLTVITMTTSISQATGGTITKAAYGTTADGIAVDEYTLTNANQMEVKIIKEGKEPSQGVGYLDDGTRVVVDGGRGHMGKMVQVVVTSVLQTAAGRMIFTRYNDVAP